MVAWGTTPAFAVARLEGSAELKRSFLGAKCIVPACSRASHHDSSAPSLWRRTGERSRAGTQDRCKQIGRHSAFWGAFELGSIGPIPRKEWLICSFWFAFPHEHPFRGSHTPRRTTTGSRQEGGSCMGAYYALAPEPEVACILSYHSPGSPNCYPFTGVRAYSEQPKFNTLVSRLC